MTFKIKLISILFIALFSTGCAVQLSPKTCGSLQSVSKRIMTDRQAGVSKEDAATKLSGFTAGRPESQHFYEVASKIIDAAYIEPLGTTVTERTEIINLFVSRMNDMCLSGELGPTYNPVTRAAPAVLVK